MATILAGQIIQRASDILQDTTNVRWPVTELIRWFNDAQRQVVIVRPDANAVTSTVRLLPNTTKQQIPADGWRLLDVVRNMGATGTVPGRAIRAIERSILDTQTSDWHSLAGETEIKHYTFDIRNPHIFYVYPKPHPVTQVWAEIIYSAAPAEVASEDTVMSLDDVYASAILDWMLYRAYSKDADYAVNKPYAEAAKAAFYEVLGVKTTSDAAVNPNQRMGADGTA